MKLREQCEIVRVNTSDNIPFSGNVLYRFRERADDLIALVRAEERIYQSQLIDVEHDKREFTVRTAYIMLEHFSSRAHESVTIKQTGHFVRICVAFGHF